MAANQSKKSKVGPGLKPNKLPRPPQNRFEFKFEFNLKRLLLWFLIFMLFVPSLIRLLGNNEQPETLSLSAMISDIKTDQVERVIDTGTEFEVYYKDSDEVRRVTVTEDTNLVQVFEFAGISSEDVEIAFEDRASGRFWFDVLLNILPIALMLFFILLIIRQARGAQDGIMGFGRSKAKVFSKGKQSVTFADVGGMKEAKDEAEEVVDFLKHPKKYRKLGARTPKGVLLVGPSGTGKTLLARAVAGEAGVPFFSMAGSEFMEMLVGVGASRVRDLFSTAKKNAPSIIFIDEIDAIGRMRGLGTAGGHDEREQTLNQILVEMDGFTPNDNVIVMAATNRGDLLDPALTRPGRFDRRVTLLLPDLEERARILKIHSGGKPFEDAVNWERIARRTVGFSGADIENMLNEAAISAARENKDKISSEHIEEAAMKVKLGPEKKRLQDKYERSMTAYHEAGHALVAHFLPHTDPVHRVSIVSRGMALGYTLTPPERDKYSQTKSELQEDIAVLLGGRTAEELVFNELTGGAASDIDKATRIARAMVSDYGMSPLGPRVWGPQYDTGDWGKAGYEPVQLSPKYQAEVDTQIVKVIEDSGKLAKKILTENRDILDKIAQVLLEQESIDGEEFTRLMGSPKAKPKLPANNS